MDLELLFTMAVSADRGRRAVTSPDGNSLTCAELDERARAGAALLAGVGGTHVGFCDTNGLAFPVALVRRRPGTAPLRAPQLPAGRRTVGTDRGRPGPRGRRLAGAGPAPTGIGVERIVESPDLLAAPSAGDGALDDHADRHRRRGPAPLHERHHRRAQGGGAPPPAPGRLRDRDHRVRRRRWPTTPPCSACRRTTSPA